ncbi:MAG: membrane protein insertase YidC, partial [Deltaproteobacteria bacterium]|nr:membrane protein insertase YidC [Deltaproteobacteria bacterium]
TVLIKILFYPLTKHSLKSMKKMSVLTPQLQLLKKKYKDDKQRQNKETMELYRRHKVNPLSGCLPMLMQMPVFIALYEVFYVAIELRHAPFMLWIVDLSAKDPYYITPIVMGISMFVQQKMTPSAMDPMQQKMMLFMPVVLTFVFLNFPAGLVLYWLTNNILSIAQQYKIHREATETVGASTDKKLAKNKKE